ncbi:hypothetical protein DPMN_102962 [Dreissena polymorpha]|uniref:Uncharacterized protein n=1 Tax=Dreissena polymorpha TaxID=45954 RepID=A0A9D4H5A3_DREPO|nr:hypothetical protein DPMN_102962 [Dreissena polymorpha]
MANRVQFEFNEDIAGSLKQIDWSIEHGKTGYGRELIAETLTNIQKQSKLIRIADTSEGGRDTVKLYESNPVASDSEDEAKITRAENKAVKKKKNATKGKSSLMTSSRFHPYAAAHMRGFYGGGRGSLFEVTDHTPAADPVVRVQPVQEVVSPAENYRTSGETVHTSREVKTPRHSLPVPGPSSSPKREKSETLKDEYFYDYTKLPKTILNTSNVTKTLLCGDDYVKILNYGKVLEQMIMFLMSLNLVIKYHFTQSHQGSY